MSWYKQDRNVFERVWAKDAKMVSVYLYLHCCAYVQDGRLYGQIVRRGSCLTTRTAVMEATGLTESEVKLRLRRLADYGEIIVRTSNKGMVITVCDYDGYNEPEDIFSLNQSTETTPQTTPWTPPLYIIDNKREDNNSLRSHFIPSKTENNKDAIYEIKARYNKTFAGVLRTWERLSSDMCHKVECCIGRYGRQSVDMVFDQVLHEKFSLGDNDTGFIADFAFIFKLKNYEGYLGRYELRQKKRRAAETQAEKDSMKEDTVKGSSWQDALQEDKNWKPKIKSNYESRRK